MTKEELQELINESVIIAINEQNYVNAVDELMDATSYLENCLYEEYALYEVADILCESELITNFRDQLKKIDDQIHANNKIIGRTSDIQNKDYARRVALLKRSFGERRKAVKDLDDDNKPGLLTLLSKKKRYKELRGNGDRLDASMQTIDRVNAENEKLKEKRKQLLADIKKEAEEKRNNLGKKNPNSIGAKLDRINEPTAAEKALAKAEEEAKKLRTTETKQTMTNKVASQLSDNASKAEANDAALNTVAKNLDSNKFEKKGSKIIAKFKNPDGTTNKKAVAIAALATAAAASIAAAAIVKKKKKKAQEAEEKLEDNE